MDPAREIRRKQDENADKGQIGPPRDEIQDRVEMEAEPLVQRQGAIRRGDPEQPFLPKLSVVRNSDGDLQSPELDDLSPLVDRLDFEEIKTLKIKYKIL